MEGNLPKYPKIPTACHCLGVNCIDLYEMLRSGKAKFVLGSEGNSRTCVPHPKETTDIKGWGAILDLIPEVDYFPKIRFDLVRRNLGTCFRVNNKVGLCSHAAK